MCGLRWRGAWAHALCVCRATWLHIEPHDEIVKLEVTTGLLDEGKSIWIGAGNVEVERHAFLPTTSNSLIATHVSLELPSAVDHRPQLSWSPPALDATPRRKGGSIA